LRRTYPLPEPGHPDPLQDIRDAAESVEQYASANSTIRLSGGDKARANLALAQAQVKAEAAIPPDIDDSGYNPRRVYSASPTRSDAQTDTIISRFNRGEDVAPGGYSASGQITLSPDERAAAAYSGISEREYAEQKRRLLWEKSRGNYT
jgi:hypothetical protein